MNRHDKAFQVGLFVIAGLALIIASILVLGGGKLFARSAHFVLHFADSVNGLTVGSPVKFKGVPIGTVTRIQVGLRQGAGQQYIPVHIAVDEGLILSADGEPVNLRDPRFLKLQIAQGLRASLELESFVTGRLYVQLDYYPDPSPPVFVQKQAVPLEIPTISTGLPEFLRTLERVDLAGLSNRLNDLLNDLNRILAEAQVKEISQQMVNSLQAIEKLVSAPDVREALKSVTRTSDEARLFLADLREQVKPVSSGLTNGTAQAAQALAQLSQAAENLQRLIGPGGRFLDDARVTMEEFSEAARSVRLLADFLHRNPRALITGRKPNE